VADLDRTAAASSPNASVPPLAAPPPEQLPPLSQVISRPRRSSGRGTTILLALAAAIAIAGVAFAGGRLTAPAAAASSGRQFGNGQFQGGNGTFPGNGGGGAFRGGIGGFGITGTVEAIGADGVTIKLASGQTVTIPIDTKTTYHATVGAAASDVTVGSTVRVTAERAGFPGASGAPSASGAPGGLTFGTATDITVTGK
jgi:hypothetical protein